MSTVTVVVIILAVVALAALIFVSVQKQRTKRLRAKFGPEYDRLVHQYGSPQKAEADLALRERRVEKLSLRDLDPPEAERFAHAWRTEQARFVDSPRETVAKADRLVGELMNAVGYPVGDFEQRAADISVDHPRVVENYRAAHRLAELDARGEGSTEDLRQAMVHYRALFEDLLSRHVVSTEEVKK